MDVGDNALTAISVARSCKIVNQKKKVYLGDVAESAGLGENPVVWRDYEFAPSELDPDTLEPIEHSFYTISKRELL